jgi:hypothetical protein
MAKMASMYRMKETGIWTSRYCNDLKKISGKCTEYQEYTFNSCDPEQWKEHKAARYVAVPINEL